MNSENICSCGGDNMTAITILLVLGICIFLIWFFESITNDAAEDEYIEVVHYTLHRKYSAAPQKVRNSSRRIAANAEKQSDGYAARRRAS